MAEWNYVKLLGEWDFQLLSSVFTRDDWVTRNPSGLCREALQNECVEKPIKT